MKNLKKYSIVVGALLLFPLAANSVVTVKDTISPEFIHNQGYSTEVSKIIEVKTKDPATPIPAEQRKTFTYWVKSFYKSLIDPTEELGNEFPGHDIQYDRTHVDDL